MEDESEVVGLILKLIDDTIAGYTTEFDYRRERLVELKKVRAWYIDSYPCW